MIKKIIRVAALQRLGRILYNSAYSLELDDAIDNIGRAVRSAFYKQPPSYLSRRS